MKTLCQLVRLYVGPEFDFDVQPVLEARDVPCCQLGGRGPRASHLGRNAWLPSQAREGEVDDAIFVGRDVSHGAKSAEASLSVAGPSQ